jgi:hypothetical protein
MPTSDTGDPLGGNSGPNKNYSGSSASGGPPSDFMKGFAKVDAMGGGDVGSNVGLIKQILRIWKHFEILFEEANLHIGYRTDTEPNMYFCRPEALTQFQNYCLQIWTY